MSPVRRRFGQHFLHDRNIVRRIVGAIDPAPTDHLVEIGPGEGAITGALLARCGRLDVVEIDRDLAAALPGRVGPGPLTVHCADALRFDFTTLATGSATLRLVGNLPYNISTPLLFHLLDQSPVFRDLHVMLQKEVGERLAAVPGSKSYGRLTVAVAVRCRLERLFAIPPGCFRPPPRVDSVFLRLLPLPPGAAGLVSAASLDTVLTRAFSMRRKRLGNGLRGLLDDGTIRGAGLDPDQRPEQLAPADFVALANLLARQQTTSR